MVIFSLPGLPVPMPAPRRLLPHRTSSGSHGMAKVFGAAFHGKLSKLRKYLEAEDDTLLEELRRQDEDRVHKKKEAQYQKEQAARANLLKLTVKGRQEQLALKAKWKADELAQDKLRIAHTMRENERLEELEKQAAAQQAHARKDNQTAVTFQIRKKEETRAREKQGEYLQLRQMQHSEKQYMKRLADMKRF